MTSFCYAAPTQGPQTLRKPQCMSTALHRYILAPSGKVILPACTISPVILQYSAMTAKRRASFKLRGSTVLEGVQWTKSRISA
jgi:hypothetical protein